jgi:hypothetical protein
MQKIRDCRELLDRHGMKIPISVDGNVSFENIPPMVAAGAGILVAGTSSVYSKAGSISGNFATTREAIAKGLRLRGTLGIPRKKRWDRHSCLSGSPGRQECLPHRHGQPTARLPVAHKPRVNKCTIQMERCGLSCCAPSATRAWNALRARSRDRAKCW